MSKTANFADNVMKVLNSNGGKYKAMRADVLAQFMPPEHGDPMMSAFAVLDKLKILAESDALGLMNSPFEIISAREQESHGFPRTVQNSDGSETPVFPRLAMPERAGTRKRTKVSVRNVEEATGQEENKQITNYWPIIAIKNSKRASIKSDMRNISDEVFRLVSREYGDKYEVIESNKSVTIRFNEKAATKEPQEKTEA